MIRPLGSFLAGALALWLLTFLPVYLFWEEYRPATPALSAAALALCLVPAALSLAWGLSAGAGSQQQLLAVFGGMAVRMFVVLGGGLLATAALPYFRDHFTAFWVWVLVYYLGTLALEIVVVTRVLVKARPAAPGR